MKAEMSEVIEIGDNENGFAGESNGGTIDDEQEVGRQEDEQE